MTYQSSNSDLHILRTQSTSDMGLSRVGVVLVNWNGAELTIPCIASLQGGKVRPDRIVVVDNASTDGSADTIASRHPEVALIQNVENLGFAGGNNVGIRRLVSEGIDYLWILNNDTEVDADCLRTLVDYMNRNSSAAACCGKILYHSQRDRIWYAGASFNRWLFRTKHRGAMEKDIGQFDRVADTPFITGCSIFVRRNVLEQVGLFDERFFAYSEDFDWCLRARRKGYRLFFVPQAIIYHKVSGSFTKKSASIKGYTTPLMIESTHRSRMHLLRKHIKSKGHLTVLFSLLIIKAVAYSTALVVLGRLSKSKAVWKGICAGMAPAEMEDD